MRLKKYSSPEITEKSVEMITAGEEKLHEMIDWQIESPYGRTKKGYDSGIKQGNVTMFTQNRRQNALRKL